jgi:hypothetical protein
MINLLLPATFIFCLAAAGVFALALLSVLGN